MKYDLDGARPSGRASSRKEETRRRLVEAAYKLFEQDGFDNVTVDQIAAAAGVARRTFFRHFKSKERVVFPYTDGRLAAYREAVRSRTGGDPASLNDLLAVYELIVLGWIENRDYMMRSRRVVEASPSLLAFDREVNARWELAIAHEVDGAACDNEPIPSLRARITAGVLVGAVRPAFERWYETEGAVDLVSLGRRALNVAARGLEAMDDTFPD